MYNLIMLYKYLVVIIILFYYYPYIHLIPNFCQYYSYYNLTVVHLEDGAHGTDSTSQSHCDYLS